MIFSVKYGISDIDDVALKLKDTMQDTGKNILAFVGPIGAGKTTFIKRLAKSYNFDEHEVTSPTFNYVNIYVTQDKLIYHFDLYRLHTELDFLEQGFQEYLHDNNSISIVEWPEIIFDLINSNALLVEIDYVDENFRNLTVKSI